MLRVSDPLRPGDPFELGGYRLLGRLGQGGMGAVFLGRAASGRLVAVKVIRPEYASDPEFRGRFRSEVSRARQVPPFCTAEVLDADPDHPTPYLVVEYVDGPSLAQVINESGPLTAGALHSVAVGVATALAAIHGAGVIHRDLKPANVLFALGTPKVIDFGIARAFEVTSQHTRTDQMVGTVAYMAPERFDTDRAAAPVGPAADVFAWGAVVAYAASGKTPFQADSAASTAARILTQPPNLTGLPGPLRRVVERTLAKEPKDRPTAHELLEQLLALGTEGESQQVRQAAEAVRRPKFHLRKLVLAAAVVLAVGIAGMVAVPRLRQALAADSGSGPVFSTPASSAPVRPSPTATKRVTVQGPSIIDRLDRPGQWTATKEDGGGCTFAHDRLEVTTSSTSVYTCAGPADTFAGDQSITVDATILSAGACAEIWFRSVADGAYQVSLCEKEIRFGVDNNGDIADEAKAATVTPVGLARRIAITVQDEQATIAVDGAELLESKLGEPALAAGKVEFGGLNDVNSGDSHAAFAGAEVRTPAPTGGTSFADLTRGSVKSVVNLRAYDAGSHSAVVEPILFMTGEKYCQTHKLKPGDARCNREWITEESHTKVTVPLAAKPKYFTWEKEDGDVCLGEKPEDGGNCPMTPKAFTSWAADNIGAMVAVTTVNGTVTRMAQIYTP